MLFSEQEKFLTLYYYRVSETKNIYLLKKILNYAINQT